MGIERSYSTRYFRERAEDFRAKADNSEHDQVKRSLRKVAENYDEVARRAERVRTAQDVDRISRAMRSLGT